LPCVTEITQSLLSNIMHSSQCNSLRANICSRRLQCLILDNNWLLA
jgi:hypothetical protein